MLLTAVIPPVRRDQPEVVYFHTARLAYVNSFFPGRIRSIYGMRARQVELYRKAHSVF